MDSNLPGIGSLIKSAWQRVKPRYGSLILIMLLPLLGMAVVLGLALVSTSFATFVNQQTPSIVMGVVTVFTLLISVLFIVFVSLWSQVAIRVAVASPQKLKPLAAYRSSLRLIWPFVWISILASLATAAGFILFVIPGLLLMILFWFADWCVVTDQVRGLKALAVSREYVRGVFWKVTWRAVVPVALLWIFVQAISWLSGWYAEQNALLFFQPIMSFVVAVASLLLMPVLFSYLFELFLVLKHRAGTVTITEKQRRKYGYLVGVGFLFVLLVVGGIVGSAMIWSQQNSSDVYDDEYYFDEYEEYEEEELNI